MVSIFSPLGKIITKHPRAIVALWVLVLLIAIPLNGVLSNNLVYDQMKLIPKDMGFFLAEDKYTEQFPSNNDSSMIVVVESANKTRAMLFIDALNRSLNGTPALTNVTGTASAYSLQRGILVNMTPDLYRGLNDGYDNVSKANRELYNATDGLRNASDGLYYLYDNVTTINDQFNGARKQILGASAQLYSARDQVQDMADAFYGIPAYYANVYAQLNASMGDVNRSNAAYQQTRAFISGGSMSPDSKAMASQYLDAFDGAWRAPPASSDPAPMSRAQKAINTAAPAFINGMISAGAISSDQGKMMLVIVSSMTLNDYLTNGATTIDNIVIGMAAGQAGGDRGSIEEIYRLGRNPSDGTIGNYLINKAVASLRSSDSGKNMTAADLQNATDMVHDAWDLGRTATKQDFDAYVLRTAGKGMNKSEKDNLTTIYGWGPHPNDTVIRDFMFEQAGKGKNASENQTLREIYGLGRNPSNDTVKQYMVSQVLKDMNLTTNASYFLALLDLPANTSNETLKAFAADWVTAHGYDDPKILPDTITGRMASGNVTLFIVDVNNSRNQSAAFENVASLRQHIADLQKDPRYSGVAAYVTGGNAMNADSATVSGDMSTALTVVMVVVILLLYFRSVLTPLMPLVLAVIAIVASMGFMGILSMGVGIYYDISMIMIAVTLGAGTDYCVFMLSRYAEERSMGADVLASVRTAVEHAGKSIASSGFTAMIGFGSLALIDRGLFMSYGLAGAASILFSMLVALTLVPAIVTIAGDRVFWPRKIYNTGPGKLTGVWRGITSKVLKHSKLVLVLALLVTIPAVTVFTQMQLGTDFVTLLPDGLESKTGYLAMDGAFGSGALEEEMVVATLPSGFKDGSGNYSNGSLGQVEEISALIAATPGVDKAYSMTRPEGATIRYDNLSSYKGPEKDQYTAYMDNNTGRDGRTTVIRFTLVGSPFSEPSRVAIDTVREKLKAYQDDHAGTELLLGGGSVGQFEYIEMTMGKYAIVIPVVLVGIFLILMLMLRSLFTPLRLVFTLLMSVAWTLGLSILVFQYGTGTNLYWIMPVYLFCVLMGLGVDYDIFLVSRIREEIMKGKTDEEAIASAIAATGTIITLCGAVMASAFGAMMLSGEVVMKQIGFVLFIGIILDATIMRMVIVPSIMVLMKKYNWWMPFVKNEARAEEKPVEVRVK